MANLLRKIPLALIAALTVALLAATLLITPTEARRHSPLLVEDEGARRNRPAGKSRDQNRII